MHYIVSYDIAQTNLRNRLAKLLLRMGFQRIQKSVFFTLDIAPKEKAKLIRKIDKLLLHADSSEEANVLIFPLDSQMLAQTISLGENPAFEKAKNPPNLMFL